MSAPSPAAQDARRFKGGVWRYGRSWKVWATVGGWLFLDAGCGRFYLSVWRLSVSADRRGGHDARSVSLTAAYRRASAKRRATEEPPK